jgi:hypothetical protein
VVVGAIPKIKYGCSPESYMTKNTQISSTKKQINLNFQFSMTKTAPLLYSFVLQYLCSRHDAIGVNTDGNLICLQAAFRR